MELTPKENKQISAEDFLENDVPILYIPSLPRFTQPAVTKSKSPWVPQGGDPLGPLRWRNAWRSLRKCVLWRPGTQAPALELHTPSANAEKITYGYESIHINSIFRGMNIHLPAIFMFTRGTRFWPTAIWIQTKLDESVKVLADTLW